MIYFKVCINLDFFQQIFILCKIINMVKVKIITKKFHIFIFNIYFS